MGELTSGRRHRSYRRHGCVLCVRDCECARSCSSGERSPLRVLAPRAFFDRLDWPVGGIVFSPALPARTPGTLSLLRDNPNCSTYLSNLVRAGLLSPFLVDSLRLFASHATPPSCNGVGGTCLIAQMETSVLANNTTRVYQLHRDAWWPTLQCCRVQTNQYMLPKGWEAALERPLSSTPQPTAPAPLFVAVLVFA